MRNEYRVLTPESVEFVYELGGLGSRMLAAAVDHLILLAALGVTWLLVVIIGVSSLSLLGAPMVVVGRIVVFVLSYAYFTYFEWRRGGQTPGKRIMDLRVIDDRGMNADLLQCLIRNLFRGVDMMPFLAAPGMFALPLEFLGMNSVGFYAIGGTIAFMSASNKRLGDWAAGTLVVRVRKGVIPEAIIAPNEKYNSLQEDAALRRRIRSRLTMEERDSLFQLCLRRNELEFEARQALFSQAANYLQERLETVRDPLLSEEKFVQNIAAIALTAAEPVNRGDQLPVGSERP